MNKKDNNYIDKKIIIHTTNSVMDSKKYKKLKQDILNDNKNIHIFTEGKSDAEYLRHIFSKNLHTQMNNNNINILKLSEDTKIKYSTVRDWASAKTYPRADKIKKLADYFDISISDLTEDKKIKDKENQQNQGGVIVPVLGRIPAGIPLEAIEEILDYEEIPAKWLTGDKQFFALRIKRQQYVSFL